MDERNNDRIDISMKNFTAVLAFFILGVYFSNSYGDTENQYKFSLTKGTGIPVCDAYLERLNNTVYEKPPYCDRPENNDVEGFSYLNRVPLTTNDVRDLYPIISRFVGTANNKATDWTDMDYQEKWSKTYEGVDLTLVDISLDRGWTKIWRYVPPIDIDNDDRPDNVEIWHGHPLLGVDGSQCGDDASHAFQNAYSLRQPQMAFLITENNRLNVIKTNEIFSHPKGGYRVTMDGKKTEASRFRPIGMSIGIFKYRNLYYFDTFFDEWGDFEGNRSWEDSMERTAEISNTLAVFLHKDGKTSQVCEYQMMESGSN